MPGSYVKTMPWGQQKPPLGYQLDRSSPFAQGLVGCWLFNEQSGYGFKNLASNINEMEDEILKPPVWAPSGLSFDGTQRITRRFNGWTNKCTIILRHKPNDIVTNSYIVSGSNSYDDGDGVCIILGYQDNYYNIFNGIYPIGGNGANSQIPATLGRTNTIAYGSDATIVKGWLNGNRIVYGNGNINQVMPVFRVVFGCNPRGTTDYNNGTIETYYFFNRLLSDTEIQYLYTNPYAAIEGYNMGRVFSVPSSAFINSSYWYQNPIQEAI